MGCIMGFYYKCIIYFDHIHSHLHVLSPHHPDVPFIFPTSPSSIYFIISLDYSENFSRVFLSKDKR